MRSAGAPQQPHTGCAAGAAPSLPRKPEARAAGGAAGASPREPARRQQRPPPEAQRHRSMRKAASREEPAPASATGQGTRADELRRRSKHRRRSRHASPQLRCMAEERKQEGRGRRGKSARSPPRQQPMAERCTAQKGGAAGSGREQVTGCLPTSSSRRSRLPRRRQRRMGLELAALADLRARIRFTFPASFPPFRSRSGPAHARHRQGRRAVFSEDSGATWEPVDSSGPGAPCWCAADRAGGNPEAAPAAKSRTREATPARARVRTDTVFELLNDQSQVWWSADGKIWIAKMNSGRCASISRREFPC